MNVLSEQIRNFTRERDWEQFHSPKNLSMSIAIEAAELMEKFQWLSLEDSQKLIKKKQSRQEIEAELADIAIYVLDFCNLYDIDLSKDITKKLKHNERKYPTAKVKGKAHKYTHYDKKEK